MLPRGIIFLALLVACTDGPATSNTDPPGDPPSLPPPQPLHDRIVFMRAVESGLPYGKTFGLWTTRIDGSDLRVLRDTLHYPSGAAVSPDGLSVAFEDWDTLYIMRSDGQNLRPLPTGLWRAQLPVWSPDGDWLYFSGLQGPNDWSQIYRMHPDGSGRERLTQGGTAAWHPTLSRDGRYLAFTRNYATALPTWLVVRDLLTGSEQTVSDSAFTGRRGQWAPDNRSLLFLDGNPARPNDWAILRYDLATRSYSFFLDSKGNRPATYSPDGRTLLYGTGDLWLADSDGTSPRVLLADSAQTFEAYWTPAGP